MPRFLEDDEDFIDHESDDEAPEGADEDEEGYLEDEETLEELDVDENGHVRPRRRPHKVEDEIDPEDD